MDLPEKAIIGVIGEVSAGLREAAIKVLGPYDALELPGAGLVILDHALALMDRLAKQRAASQLTRFRKAGGTVLLVSNDEDFIEELCDELWWVTGEHETHRGSPGEVLREYRAHVAREVRAAANGEGAEMLPSIRRGDGRAHVEGVELLGESGQPTIVWASGESARIRVSVRFERAVEDPVIGMLIRTRIGLNVYGTNTELERLQLGPCAAGQRIAVTFEFKCELCPGEYTLTVASHDPDGVWHDWLEDATAFSVSDSRYTAGVANLRARATRE